MRRPRIIPTLLLRRSGFIKTVRFDVPRYIGEAMNAVRIFNEKRADELIILDVLATSERRPPDLLLLRDIVAECFMPVCYGGGVRSLADMDGLFKSGVEKVALNAIAVEQPAIIRLAADRYGSSSVVVVIDVARSPGGRLEVVTHRGKKSSGLDPIEHVKRVAGEGAGEIVVQSVDRDGTRHGYDIDLIRAVSSAVSVPVVALGGAASIEDLARACVVGGASAASAGSMFVYYGRHDAVLISLPELRDIMTAFASIGRA